MLEIRCSWCGLRSEEEFAYGGEDGVVRPDPETTTDAEWTDYLFLKRNIAGSFRELWQHRFGCGRWFVVVRNTRTSEIITTERLAGAQR